MKIYGIMNLFEISKKFKQVNISKRYITNTHIVPFLESLPSSRFKLKIEGKSVNNQNIYSIIVGEGKTKIYMWSQMHGNESTTTKAIIDFLAFLNSEDEIANSIIKDFTFYIIPILNPDGAKAYTRVNANEVDLNRDSVDLTQPESQLLRKLFDQFKPDFAFNMHDQRTLFAAGNTNNPATISFLAPAFNKETEINEVRTTAMQVIAEMFSELNKEIPNKIGRFDDAFNLNCIGDRFTNLGVPTILFEAGHYPKDYDREITREIVFVALLKAVLSIQSKSYLNKSLSEYFNIPENHKLINDILLKNVTLINNENRSIANLGIQYKEELKNEEIIFKATIDTELIKNHQFGHLELDATDFELSTNDDICEILNKMKLDQHKNGVFDVNYLLKY